MRKTSVKSVVAMVARLRYKLDFSIGSFNLLVKSEQMKLSELPESIKQFLVKTPPTFSVILDFRRISCVFVSIEASVGPLETSKVAAELADFWSYLRDRQHLAKWPSFEQFLHVAPFAGHFDIGRLLKLQKKHFCLKDAVIGSSG